MRTTFLSGSSHLLPTNTRLTTSQFWSISCNHLKFGPEIDQEWSLKEIFSLTGSQNEPGKVAIKKKPRAREDALSVADRLLLPVPDVSRLLYFTIQNKKFPNAGGVRHSGSDHIIQTLNTETSRASALKHSPEVSQNKQSCVR